MNSSPFSDVENGPHIESPCHHHFFFSSCSIGSYILGNERYIGDLLLQKTYIADYLTRRKEKNEGELPQYYIEFSHPPIVTKEVFELTQALLAEMPRKFSERSVCQYPFSAKLVCGLCGASYGRRIFHSNSKYRRIMWRCNRRYDKNRPCPNKDVAGLVIEEAFVDAVNRLFAGYGDVAAECTRLIRIKGTEPADEERRRQIIELLTERPPLVTDFDEGIWYALIDHAVITPVRQAKFVARDGRVL